MGGFEFNFLYDALLSLLIVLKVFYIPSLTLKDHIDRPKDMEFKDTQRNY